MIKTEDKYYQSNNILTKEALDKKIASLKKEGKKIGMCTGSFDLMHPGHISHFISAKKICDVLVVCVAHDWFNKSKANTKGRPIFSEQSRAFSVSQLKPVDFVVFNENNWEIIQLIKPDYYIKGPDYNKERKELKISEEFLKELNKNIENIRSVGGEIYFTDDEKLSTTDIIKYIKKEVDQ